MKSSHLKLLVPSKNPLKLPWARFFFLPPFLRTPYYFGIKNIGDEERDYSVKWTLTMAELFCFGRRLAAERSIIPCFARVDCSWQPSIFIQLLISENAPSSNRSAPQVWLSPLHIQINFIENQWFSCLQKVKLLLQLVFLSFFITFLIGQWQQYYVFYLYIFLQSVQSHLPIKRTTF